VAVVVVDDGGGNKESGGEYAGGKAELFGKEGGAEGAAKLGCLFSGKVQEVSKVIKL
jgi:hypothetical protein